jgi:hypothetical protein
MTSSHTSYEDLATGRRDSDHYRQGHAEAERAYLLGKAVRDRRLALGLSQTELAMRAAMTSPPCPASRPAASSLPSRCWTAYRPRSTPTSSSRYRRTRYSP